MKKYFLIILLSFSLSPCFGQEVNAREDRLFELVNNFSTAYLFNTYGLIGSIADGYDKDAYDESTVSDLLNAQKKLAGDLVALLEKKLEEETFPDLKKKNYMASFIPVLNEFILQIDLFLKVVKNDSRKNKDAYIEQRKKSWKDISKLVGIDD